MISDEVRRITKIRDGKAMRIYRRLSTYACPAELVHGILLGVTKNGVTQLVNSGGMFHGKPAKIEEAWKIGAC